MSVITQAQATDVFIEWAAQSDTNTVTVHVRVPRGQEIEVATIGDDATLSLLEAQPAPMNTTTWLVIDASATMLNFQSPVQTSLQRWLTSDSTLRDGEVGLIAYNNDLQIAEPSRFQSQVDDFLAEYTVTANTVGCLGDALTTIAEREREVNRSVRILVITAEWSRQTTCTQSAVPDDLLAPIEMIILANEENTDDALIELAERGGTMPLFANVRLLDTRLDEIQAAWDNPTFRLDATFANPLPSNATITVNLSNGDAITQQVQFDIFVQPPTPIASPTVPTATLIAPTETASPTTTIAPTSTDVPDEPTATNMQAEPTATDVPPTVTSTPQPETTEAAIASAPTEVTDTEAPSASDMDDNLPLLLLIGGTLFVIGIGFVVIAFTRLGNTANKTDSDPPKKDDSSSFYDTLDKPTDALRTPVVQVNPAKQGGVANEIDQLITRMEDVEAIENANPIEQTGMVDMDTDLLNQMKTISDPDHPTGHPNDSQAIITQMLSDEQFRAMMNQSQDDEEVVAWLQVVSGDRKTSYDLTRRGAIVGRGKDCDIQITGDSAVSRQHVQFTVPEDFNITVSRLSANNPVVVGGVQVSNRHPLQPNDVVYLSDRTYIVFVLNDDNDDTATLI